MSQDDQQTKRERSDVRRNMERVLRAAESLFAERGAEVTMGEVAARAGVGVGTIYRRFPSKELLFAAVSRAACADTCLCVAQAVEELSDPAEKLRAILQAQFRHSLHHAALLDVPDEEQDPDQHGIYATLHALTSQVIAEGQALGRFRGGDPAMLAALCMELLAPRAVRRLARLAEGCDAAANHAAAFVLGALRPDPRHSLPG